MFKNLLKTLSGATAPTTSPAPAATQDEARALIARGNAAEDAGRLEEALGLYRQALDLAPQLPAAHLNLGIALEAMGQPAAARASYERALALQAGHPYAAYNLAKLDYQEGRLAEAATLLRQALQHKPDFVQAWILQSNLRDAQGDSAGALAAIDEALRLQPQFAGALFNRAGILRKLGRADEAEEAARAAAALAPDAEHLALHAALLVPQGFADEGLAQMRRAIALAPHRFDLRSKELYLLNLVEGSSGAEVFERHRALGRELESVVRSRGVRAADPGKPRLRLGFVSGELRTHPVALFLLPLLERIDRGRFEVFCYASNVQKDGMTRLLAAASDRFVDASQWKDDRLEQQIADDGIDLLVDLDGHTSQVRLPVFAARPAPAQLTWVGYLNTTGLTRMDYRLTDARCDPPATSAALHTERLLLLPHSQWCYRPLLDVPEAAAAPCERNGFVTFGSLNNVVKLTPQMARRWGRLLQALPTARLVVADVSSARKREALLAAIVEGGGEAQRVRFAPRTDLEGYFRLMDDIDIALDSFPYGGGTTTFDALWMGVPVVTASGELPASRSASSVLAALGLDDWIAPGIEGFEACALARAADLAELARLRRTLRGRLRASPLMDEAGFVAAFQALLEQAWREQAGATK